MALGLGVAGCASLEPGRLPVGTPIAQVRAGLLKPTAEYLLPGGGTRLEYSRGAWGRETSMLDFDATGRLTGSQQVLTEPNFATIAPGLTQDELRMRLGRPAEVFTIGWQHQQVWNWRYAGGDCTWFQVAIDQPTHRVVSSGIAQDPACDTKSRD